MSLFDFKPHDLIECSELLENSYLRPYWQYYYKDINISFVTEDQYKDLSFIRLNPNLSTLAISDDFVSIYLKNF